MPSQRKVTFTYVQGEKYMSDIGFEKEMKYRQSKWMEFDEKFKGRYIPPNLDKDIFGGTAS